MSRSVVDIAETELNGVVAAESKPSSVVVTAKSKLIVVVDTSKSDSAVSWTSMNQ
jgi:hypothetical protein